MNATSIETKLVFKWSNSNQKKKSFKIYVENIRKRIAVIDLKYNFELRDKSYIESNKTWFPCSKLFCMFKAHKNSIYILLNPLYPLCNTILQTIKWLTVLLIQILCKYSCWFRSTQSGYECRKVWNEFTD